MKMNDYFFDAIQALSRDTQNYTPDTATPHL